MDRYPTLPNGAREGCFSANRTGKDGPANKEQAARRYAIDSSAPDQFPERSSVARTRSSPGFFFRSDRSASSRTGAIPVRVPGLPFAVGTSLRHAPKCRSRRLYKSFNSNEHGLDTVLRSLCRKEEVEQNMKMSFGSRLQKLWCKLAKGCALDIPKTRRVSAARGSVRGVKLLVSHHTGVAHERFPRASPG